MANKLLSDIISNPRSTVAQARGNLDNSSGTGGFSVASGENGVSISAHFNELLKKKRVGNRTRSPIKELYKPNGGKTYKPLVYPDNLDNSYYMIFNVVERNRPSRKEIGTRRTIRSVVLPIPSELSVGYGVEYTDDSFGSIGGASAGLVGADDIKSGTAGLGEIIGQKISAAKDAFKNRDTDAAVQALGILTPAIATTASTLGAGAIAGLLTAGVTGDGVVSGISFSEGLTINPHMAVLFKGVGFREHAFNYKFIAKNQSESNTIKNIIKVFKYYMHPSYFNGSNLAFQYPDEFEIEFAQAVSDNLYKVGTSVLKSFNVNYNGENTPLFFEDTGAPVSIDIQMQFQETRIMTKDDMDDPDLDTMNEFGDYL